MGSATARKAKSTATAFVQELAALRFDNVFNPYVDACPEHDERDAASTRQHNLELVLEAALCRRVESIWIARDLGYRGGRRTGLALTDELHLSWCAELLGTPPLLRATKGEIVKERTATVVWDTIRAIGQPVFLWNVFPFHPHAPNDPMSNRGHTRIERMACRPILMRLLDVLEPRIVVTIGRDAHSALDELGVSSTTVRHPSYGGQNEFITGLFNLYGVKANSELEFTPLCLNGTYAAGRGAARI
jgi:hypothetical protein